MPCPRALVKPRRSRWQAPRKRSARPATHTSPPQGGGTACFFCSPPSIHATKDTHTISAATVADPNASSTYCIITSGGAWGGPRSANPCLGQWTGAALGSCAADLELISHRVDAKVCNSQILQKGIRTSVFSPAPTGRLSDSVHAATFKVNGCVLSERIRKFGSSAALRQNMWSHLPR